MTMKTLSRRTVLRGAGGAVIALPFLEAMSRAAVPASSTMGRNGQPKRLLTYFTPTGTIPAAFYPNGSEMGFTIAPGSCLEPMAKHRADMLVMKGVNIAVAGDRGLHPYSHQAVLTGYKGRGRSGAGANYFDAGAAVISVDQAIADKIPAAKIRYVLAGIQRGRDPNSFKNGTAVPVENDPRTMFDRLFADVPAGGAGSANSAARDRLRAQRHSILDDVKEGLEKLQVRVSGSDRLRVEEHLTSIREVEMQIDRVVSANCERPDAPLAAGENTVQIGEVQTKMLVMAFKCDLTRVAGLWWKGSPDTKPLPWIGVNQGHHDLSHNGASNAAARESLVKISRFYMGELAKLVQMLKDTPDGGGTLLDNTLVFHYSEVAEGDVHSYKDVPFLLVGSAGGYFRTGRYIQYPALPHNRLLISVMNAMGVPATTFGDPQFGADGPLPNLT